MDKCPLSWVNALLIRKYPLVGECPLVGKCSPVIGECLRWGWKTFSCTLSTLIARFMDLGLNFVPQCPIMYPNVAFSRKIWEWFLNTHPLRRFRHAPGMKSWLYMPEVTLGLPTRWLRQ